MPPLCARLSKDFAGLPELHVMTDLAASPVCMILGIRLLFIV
jgi:hypothetical protein